MISICSASGYKRIKSVVGQPDNTVGHHGYKILKRLKFFVIFSSTICDSDSITFLGLGY